MAIWLTKFLKRATNHVKTEVAAMVWKFYVNTSISRETICQFVGWNRSFRQKDVNSNICRRTCKDKLSSLLLENSFDLTDALYTELVC